VNFETVSSAHLSGLHRTIQRGGNVGVGAGVTDGRNDEVRRVWNTRDEVGVVDLIGGVGLGSRGGYLGDDADRSVSVPVLNDEGLHPLGAGVAQLGPIESVLIVDEGGALVDWSIAFIVIELVEFVLVGRHGLGAGGIVDDDVVNEVGTIEDGERFDVSGARG